MKAGSIPAPLNQQHTDWVVVLEIFRPRSGMRAKLLGSAGKPGASGGGGGRERGMHSVARDRGCTRSFACEALP